MTGDTFDAGQPPATTPASRAQASAWLARHDRGLSPRETEEFHAWLRQDPVHEIAWHESSALWNSLDRLTVHRAMADAPVPRQFSRRRWAPAIGAAAAAALAFGAWQFLGGSLVPMAPDNAAMAKTLPDSNPASESVPVEAGIPSDGLAEWQSLSGTPSKINRSKEIRSVRLSDGTVVSLRPEAIFRDTMNELLPRARSGDVFAGEVLFDVKADVDAPPFIITAGENNRSEGVMVTTRGAVFAIAMKDGYVETRVIEGTVAVRAAARQRSSFRSSSEVPGTTVGAGVLARVEYPSHPDSETHVAPLFAADFVTLAEWHRAVEAAPASPNFQVRKNLPALQ